MEHARTIVIGGGLAGLTAAATLARGGHAVTVVEGAEHVGGRGRSRHRDGFDLNTGPHALYRTAGGRAVLRDLGVAVARQAAPLRPRRRVDRRGGRPARPAPAPQRRRPGSGPQGDDRPRSPRRGRLGRPAGQRVDRLGHRRRAGSPAAGVAGAHDDLQRRHLAPRRRRRHDPAAHRHARRAVPPPRVVEPRRRPRRRRPGQRRRAPDRDAGRRRSSTTSACTPCAWPTAARCRLAASSSPSTTRAVPPGCSRGDAAAPRRARRRRPSRCAWPTSTSPCGRSPRTASPPCSASTTRSSSPCPARSPTWRRTAATSSRSPATCDPARSAATTGRASRPSSTPTSRTGATTSSTPATCRARSSAATTPGPATRGHGRPSRRRCRRRARPGARRRLGRPGRDAGRRVDPVRSGRDGRRGQLEPVAERDMLERLSDDRDGRTSWADASIERTDVDAFEAARPRLLGIAYRMLGSRAEAEDVVGDVAERWTAADRATIREPRGLARHGHDPAGARRAALGPRAARGVPGHVAARAGRHRRRPGHGRRAAGVADDGLPRAARAADADRAGRARAPRRARPPLRARRRGRRALRGRLPPGAVPGPQARHRAGPSDAGRAPAGRGGRDALPHRRHRRRRRCPARRAGAGRRRHERRRRCRPGRDPSGRRCRTASPASCATSARASATTRSSCRARSTATRASSSTSPDGLVGAVHRDRRRRGHGDPRRSPTPPSWSGSSPRWDRSRRAAQACGRRCGRSATGTASRSAERSRREVDTRCPLLGAMMVRHD